MSPDVDRITSEINAFWDSFAGWIFVAGFVALLLLAAVVVRQWRRRDFSAKASLGFGLVQAGVTYAVVLGVYEFTAIRFGMPVVEAVVLAVIVEAATWVAVGLVASHARKGGVGFGPGGPFFWVAVLGGGTLAVAGSTSAATAVGRAVIVALGAYMWYLRLLQIVKRPAKPGVVWTWTPTRLLQALGAIEPRTDDAATQNDAAREYQVRRLARAIRWANSRHPWRWFGMRALARRAESVHEDVISEARRRWAVAHVLRDQSLVSSPVMSAMVAAVERAELARAGETPAAAAAEQEEGPEEAADVPVGEPVSVAAATPEVERDAVPDTPAGLTDQWVADPAVASAAPVTGASAPVSPAGPEVPHRANGWSAPPRPRAQATTRPAPARPATPPAPSAQGVLALTAQPAIEARPATVAGEGQELPLKVQAYALLDAEVRVDDPRGTQELAQYVVDQLGGKVDTAKRYIRDWRAEVVAGQRPQAIAKRLRVVPGH